MKLFGFHLTLPKMLCILAGIVLSAFLLSVNNGFVWDDVRLVQGHSDLGRVGRVFDLFLGESLFQTQGKESSKHIYYKPVLGMWWMLNYMVWEGSHAFGFHLFQLILHLVNVILVFFVVNKISKTFNGESSQNLVIAFWVALIWGIHPANTESVVYIAGGQEPLYLFFGLLTALVISNRDFIQDKLIKLNWTHQQVQLMWGIVIASGYLLSMLSKEAGIMVGPVLLALLWFMGERKQLYQVGVWFLLSIGIYLSLRLGLAGVGFSVRTSQIPIHAASLNQRLLTVLYVLSEHLRVMTFPKDLFIGNNVVIKSIDLMWMLRLGAVGSVVAAMTWLSKENSLRKWLLISGILTLGLVSNVLPLDMTHSERWVYLPVLFFVWFWLSVFFEYVGPKNVWLLVVISMLMWVRVFVRVPTWKDPLTLMSNDARYPVNNFQVLIGYAHELEGTGQYAKQVELLQEAITMNPEYPIGYTNLGFVYDQMREYSLAEEYYLKALEQGADIGALINLISLLHEQGDPAWLDLVNQGLRIYPYNEKILYFKQEADTIEATQSGRLLED